MMTTSSLSMRIDVGPKLPATAGADIDGKRKYQENGTVPESTVVCAVSSEIIGRRVSAYVYQEMAEIGCVPPLCHQ